MTGRHSRSIPGGQDRSSADGEAEAIATATAIAGLRWRLQRPEIFDHPKVRIELRKFEEQITGQLDHADAGPGRHRSATGKTPSQQISDADGFDLKPDPLAASTPAEFIEALRQYRAWSGNPSWRQMARQAGQAVVHSTMHAAMNGDTMPKFDVVKAIVAGCGGSDDDLRAFATAWRCITHGSTLNPPSNGECLAAPVPTHPLVPAQ
jgi:hypothetical protein